MTKHEYSPTGDLIWPRSFEGFLSGCFKSFQTLSSSPRQRVITRTAWETSERPRTVTERPLPSPTRPDLESISPRFALPSSIMDASSSPLSFKAQARTSLERPNFGDLLSAEIWNLIFKNVKLEGSKEGVLAFVIWTLFYPFSSNSIPTNLEVDRTTGCPACMQAIWCNGSTHYVPFLSSQRRCHN